VTVSLPPGPIDAFSGTAISLRAQVARNGQPVADNSAVSFTTDFGFFNENGLATIVKSTLSGAADVSPGALASGTAHVKASFDCGSASVQINFQVPPDAGPYISDVQPSTGSANGGDTVVIYGGGFGNSLTAVSSVTFGGTPSGPDSVANTRITVRSPPHTMANPAVPETVDVCVRFFSGLAQTCKARAFTYVGINPDKKVFISSVSPSSGSQAGGEAVTIQGGNFGTSAATTRVTFCGLPATVTSVADTAIAVMTPAHKNASSAVSEGCDVVATIDLGKVSQQSAVLPQGFTYRGGGGGGTCGSDPSLFISNVSPNTGPPDGGTSVAITGGGFPTVPANVRVDFGGIAAQVTSVTGSSIGVVTPRRTLANPDVPETVDVTVTDLGSATQRCARLVAGFTYTRLALDPTIYSISPRTGPNDAATRVTIFGTGFQFPEQVFMTGGTCGTQRIEVPVVSPVTLTQIVVETPRAAGAYACLAGSQVDLEVLNPTTGKKASCPGCFKYYGCPTAIAATPAVIPTETATAVVVSGNNFEEPAEATFELAGFPAYRLTVSSVSSTGVVVQMPPLATIAPGLPACQSYTGNIRIRSTALSCDATSTPITYRANTPTISSFSPTTTIQLGGDSITVLGSGFGGSMTAAVTKDGAVVGSPVVATVNSSGSLTFTAPFIPDSAFNRQNCAGGTQAIPTTFGVRVTNTLSGCSNNLSGLVITPTSSACTSALAITTSSLPAAVACTPYSQSVTVTGGVPPYFNFTANGLPTGLSISSSTGLITGTPVLAATGAGGSVPMTVTLGVHDTGAATASKSIPILFSDPTGPFAVNGATSQNVPATGLASTSLSVTGGSGTINWVLTGFPVGLSLSPTTGPTTTLQGAGLAANTYTVTVTATDSLCAPAHTSSLTVTVISP